MTVEFGDIIIWRCECGYGEKGIISPSNPIPSRSAEQFRTTVLKVSSNGELFVKSSGFRLNEVFSPCS